MKCSLDIAHQMQVVIFFLPVLNNLVFHFCLFHELKLAASVLEAVLGVTRYSELTLPKNGTELSFKASDDIELSTCPSF